MKKENKYCIETTEGWTSGFFNIYQARNGGIFIQMGNKFTELSHEQILHLGLLLHDLKDFDHDEYLKHYNLK